MLKIVGDINFTDGFFDTGFGVGFSVKSGADPFKYINRVDTDFWIGNFECVCADVSNKNNLYRKQFIISPQELFCISHFDLYGVANNHVMQHGGVAYVDMLKHFHDNNISVVGSKESKSYVFEHQGKKIGILAFSLRPDNFSDCPLYWAMPENDEIIAEVDKLVGCDFIIAYIHWGNEFMNYPYNDQKLYAHWLIDSGIDLVVGMHSHVLQGYEVYKEKYIYYSLGNFVFNMAWDDTKYSIVLNIDFSGKELEISYDYVKIGRDYFPRYISKSKVPPSFVFESLNPLVIHNEENEIYYSKLFIRMKKYRNENYKEIISKIFCFNKKDIFLILNDFVKRKFSKK